MKVPGQPINKDVGARIRKRRQRLGIHMEELGERIGCSMPMVSRYELGQSVITVDILARVAVALQCEMADFLEDR